MSRTNRRLLVLIAVEVIVGGVFVGRRLTRLVPPEPDWALLEPATAAEIRAATVGCESAEDWRKLGELYMADGWFRESEMCHRVACKLAPNDANCARQWAFALERLALFDEANAQYRRAAQLNPEQADACAYFIARNHLRADKPQEARAVFAGGKALDANRYELARLHLRAGEFAEAGVLLEGLLAKHPNTLQVHHLGYRLALERGDLRRAATHADAARYATDKLPTPFDEEALRVIKVTQMLGSGRKWKEARDLIEAGRLDEAEKILREAKEVYPNLDADELLAEIALRRGRFAESTALLEAFATRGGQSARVADRIGDVWAAAGQGGKARANWLRAVQLEAGLNLKSAHHKLAKSFAMAGDKTAAEWHLARGHYFVGRDLLQFGYPDKAVDYFVAAGRYDPNMAQAWFYLGEGRRRAGQKEQAATAYHACLKLSPNHGRALASLALIERATGK